MTLQDMEFAVLTAIGFCILICLVKKNKTDTSLLGIQTEYLDRMKLNMEFWEEIAEWDRRPDKNQVSTLATDDNRSTTVK